MTAKRSSEKLPSNTDPPDNSFVSPNKDNRTINTRRPETKNSKTTSQKQQQIAK